MTSLTSLDLQGAIRGIGHPFEQDSEFYPTRPKSPSLELHDDSWLVKTIRHRNACMHNLKIVREQLMSDQKLANRAMLEDRKLFLQTEVGICQRMLAMFTEGVQ